MSQYLHLLLPIFLHLVEGLQLLPLQLLPLNLHHQEGAEVGLGWTGHKFIHQLSKEKGGWEDQERILDCNFIYYELS